MKIKVLCWIQFQNRARRFEGTTESLTRTGMLIRLNGPNGNSQLAAVGDSMEVEVALPSNASGERNVMHCRGNVTRMRIDEEGTCWVSGDIQSMKFRGMPPALVSSDTALRRLVM